MKKQKVKEKAFAFAALLFEKTSECMKFAAELLKGERAIQIKIVEKKKEKEV